VNIKSLVFSEDPRGPRSKEIIHHRADEGEGHSHGHSHSHGHGHHHHHENDHKH
jgi:hypothetical protein